ncbi:DUF3967 domain-containing protein [Bacillus cereus]|uniref:DUF3967 domain-containing protein n=1 Tax=Bacillus TaxID=1386 RepID=UPI000F8E11DA|nr:DUF3967 domain-containing protein [Bacillus thuringiensis]HDR3896901.1 DUF3967 domain-containing protein [Bacillus cereus]HDR7495127.1 DUF3967 domain-containing protein [Bacillus cereus]
MRILVSLAFIPYFPQLSAFLLLYRGYFDMNTSSQTFREVQEVKKMLVSSNNKKGYEFWK